MSEGETRGSRRSITSCEHWKRSMGGIVKLRDCAAARGAKRGRRSGRECMVNGDTRRVEQKGRS